MLELTLATLLSTMSEDFCVLMEKNDDVVKSTLLAYSCLLYTSDAADE